MYKIQHSTFYSKTEICTHLLPRKSNKWKNPYLLLAWTTPSRQTTPILVNKKKKKKNTTIPLSTLLQNYLCSITNGMAK